MTMVGLAVMVMAVTLVVLAAAIVPAFLEIRKAAVASRETLERIESDLRPLLRELRDTLTDLNLIVHETAEKKEDVASFMGALGDTGRSLRTINSVAGTVAGFLASSSLWLTGAKVAGKYALDKFISKGGKKHVEQ